MASCDLRGSPDLATEDAIACASYASMDATYRAGNRFLADQYLYVPEYYMEPKRFGEENAVLFPLGTRLCDKEVVLYRGNNNVAPIHANLKKTNFLLPYCECDTYRNGLVCDSGKCCSRSHQLFDNMTKRHGWSDKDRDHRRVCH